MKTIVISIIAFSHLLISCISNSIRAEKTENQQTEQTNKQEDLKNSLKLKFTGFELGDAEHYFFEDEKGKSFEFGAIEINNLEFAVELPEKEANSDNQGFGPNKNLINKWFKIKSEQKEMQLYPDGPTGKVDVITWAELVK
jgi:hypothetical protein